MLNSTGNSPIRLEALGRVCDQCDTALHGLDADPELGRLGHVGSRAGKRSANWLPLRPGSDPASINVSAKKWSRPFRGSEGLTRFIGIDIMVTLCYREVFSLLARKPPTASKAKKHPSAARTRRVCGEPPGRRGFHLIWMQPEGQPMIVSGLGEWQLVALTAHRLLPETFNRVESHLTHRKQSIAYRATRDSSHRAFASAFASDSSHVASSLRLRASSIQNLIGTPERLETPLSHTKQTTGPVLIGTDLIPPNVALGWLPPRRTTVLPFTNHESPVTNHGPSDAIIRLQATSKHGAHLLARRVWA